MTRFLEMPLGEFIDMAASDSPVPGGGGIAALAGSLGAAMATMAANFTVGKPKFVQHDALMRQILDALSPIIQNLKHAVDADADAFSRIAEAYRLPKDGDAAKAERKAAIDAALDASMRVPGSVLAECLNAARLLPPLAEVGNPNLLSDVEVAGIMLEAAARAARVNVFANSTSLATDEARRAEAEADGIVPLVAELSSRAAAIIADRRKA